MSFPQQVVGFEALARGPEGPLQAPTQLFAAARSIGRLGELDWVCRAAAFRGMLDAQPHPSVSLFVNVEPDSLMEPCPDELLDTIQEATGKLPDGHRMRDESCFVALSPSMASMVAAKPSAHPVGPEPTWDVVVTQDHNLCRTVLRELLGIADTLAGGVYFNPR